MPTRPISVKDYADQEGVSPDAIVRRIERGRLRGEKIDGRWYVMPDAILEVQGLVPTDATVEVPTVTLGEIVRGLQSELASKGREVADLKHQLGQVEERLVHAQAELRATERALRRANRLIEELEARAGNG